MRKILIIAPYTTLPGEVGFNRLGYLAEKLASSGNDVYLVTSNFNHGNKAFRNILEINNRLNSCGYKVKFIKELGYKKNVGLDRVKSHFYFNKNLKLFFRNMMEKPDVIYCAYPTMGAAYISGKFAKENKIPFILDIQDVWPESIKTAINLPGKIVDFLIFPFTIYANKIYSMADFIIGVSQTYVDRAKKVNNKAKGFLRIFIGTDLHYFDQFRFDSVEKSEGEFWITYIGNLSYSYDIETVIKAVTILKGKGYEKIKFKIMGGGPFVDRFKNYARRLNAPVDFLGYKKHEEMIPFLVNSDIAVNAISRGSQSSITNKIGDYLAAGLPVLNSSMNKEFMSMVENYKLGLNYLPGDYKKLTDHIEYLYSNKKERIKFGENSRKLAEKCFDRGNTYKKICEVIENI